MVHVFFFYKVMKTLAVLFLDCLNVKSNILKLQKKFEH